MKKSRVLSLVMSAAMGLSLLAGCAPADAPAGGDAPAGSAAAFKVGGTGPLTGDAAIYGNAAYHGAQIAVDEIKAAGGPIQFELKYEDDENDAEKAVNAYNALKDWGMQLSLGSVTSTPSVATSAESNADRIFFFTPSASSTDVLGGVVNPLTGSVDVPRKDNVFQMCFVDPNQGSASAQYIKDQSLATKVAVIYQNDSVYSLGIYNSFKAKAEELGIEVVSATTFTTGSQNDFTVQVTDAKNNGAELIFLPIYYTPASLILKQAKDMGYDTKFFGVDGMDGILAMKGFDTTLAEGVMLLTPFNADATDEKTAAFVKAYQEKYNETPNQFAADGYDCIYAYKDALEKAACTPDMSAEELCEKLMTAFTEIQHDGLTGDGMTWGADGAVTKAPKGMVIESGAYVGMD